jgi:hypothetical protein
MRGAIPFAENRPPDAGLHSVPVSNVDMGLIEIRSKR